MYELSYIVTLVPGVAVRIRSLFTCLLGLVLTLGMAAPAPAAPVPVAIAAAGDLRGVLEELKTKFEASRPDVQLQLSFGASGSLTAQILQGAPFDLFLAADEGYPEQVRKAGLGADPGPFPYAVGSLTLWVRKDLGLDPARDGWKVLASTRIQKISIANPQVAPYGRAAEAALRHASLYDGVKARLVFADNIAQAAQFCQTGSAEAGLLSAAQANNPALRDLGVTWKVPAEAYPPLRQAGVILKRTSYLEQAKAFQAYLLGPDGQGILARHGFGKP
jgi:molybdate transport system substrate-binding protein